MIDVPEYAVRSRVPNQLTRYRSGRARRVWYIRRAPLLLTLVTSFFFGGIISELVQSALPVSFPPLSQS